MKNNKKTAEVEIEEFRSQTETSLKNIVALYESMMRDEKNLARLLELIGEIPINIGSENDHKRDP